MVKNIRLKILKLSALSPDIRKELIKGFCYYIQYILWGQFQSFKPLESINCKNESKEDIPEILAAYKLLYANISSFKDCKCRTYVLYKLCKNKIYTKLLFGTARDGDNNILAHCWIETKNNENISDLNNEHLQFNIPLSKINNGR